MSGAETEPTSRVTGPAAGRPRATHRLSFWLKELPFVLVLILTTLGVAYTSFSKEPIVGFWELLAPLIALVCIGSGWPSAADKTARLILIGSQVLHWLAFIVVMNMLLLPSVQRDFTANFDRARGLYLAGARHLYRGPASVFLASVCILGLVMALTVPVIAWIQNSALIVAVIFVLMLAVGVVVWWHWRKSARADPG